MDPKTVSLAKGPVDKSAAQDLPKHPAPAGAVPESLELPPKWRDDKPIQCIAGRGPLDDATATILAQLLEKHGLGADVVPHDAVSRNSIGGFKREGVPMVCVCYLDMSRHTSPLRFLLKRLRQRRRRRAAPCRFVACRSSCHVGSESKSCPKRGRVCELVAGCRERLPEGRSRRRGRLQARAYYHRRERAVEGGRAAI